MGVNVFVDRSSTRVLIIVWLVVGGYVFDGWRRHKQSGGISEALSLFIVHRRSFICHRRSPAIPQWQM